MTSCDTEVVLHAYVEWGTDCFARFNGMWALADPRPPRRASELRASSSRATTSGSSRCTGRRRARAGCSSRRRRRRCSPIPTCASAPDRQWLYDYLLHGLHDHKPETAFTGVRALAAATWAVVDSSGVHEQVYWEPALATDAANDPAEFGAQFERSVERRLVADVPAGTCLSGGIDSSSIVTVSNRLLAAHVPDAVSLGDHLKTFSIVYDGDPIDEREYMDAVLAEVDAEPAFAEPTSEQFVERARPRRVAPGRADRLDRAVRAVVRDAARAAEGHRAAQRAGGRRAARRLRAVPVRVPPRAAPPPPAARLRRRGVGVARCAAPAGEAASRRTAAARSRSHRCCVPTSPEVSNRRATNGRRTISSGGWSPTSRRSRSRHSFATRIATRWRSRWSRACRSSTRSSSTGCCGCRRRRSCTAAGAARSCARACAGVLTEKVRTRRWKVGFTTPESRWLRARRAAMQGLFRSPAVLRPPVLGRHCARRRVRTVLRR